MSSPLRYSQSATWEQLGAFVDRVDARGPERPQAITRVLEEASSGYGRVTLVDVMRLGAELASTQPERAAALVDRYILLTYRGQPCGLSPNELIATHELQLTCLASGKWSVQEFCGRFRNLFLAQPRNLHVPEQASAQLAAYVPRAQGWSRI